MSFVFLLCSLAKIAPDFTGTLLFYRSSFSFVNTFPVQRDFEWKHCSDTDQQSEKLSAPENLCPASIISSPSPFSSTHSQKSPSVQSGFYWARSADVTFTAALHWIQSPANNVICGYYSSCILVGVIVTGPRNRLCFSRLSAPLSGLLLLDRWATLCCNFCLSASYLGSYCTSCLHSSLWGSGAAIHLQTGNCSEHFRITDRNQTSTFSSDSNPPQTDLIKTLQQYTLCHFFKSWLSFHSSPLFLPPPTISLKWH